MPSTIIVCDTCRWQPDLRRREEDGKTGGEVLAGLIERTAQEAGAVQVRRHSCLMGCKRHCNVAVTAPGKVSFYLTEFAPEQASAEAIVAYAELHAGSEDGIVPRTEWPEGVKGHFMGRIPVLDPETGVA